MDQNNDYQKLSQELDDIIARLQSGDITINDALPAYERAQRLLSELEQLVTSAENTVTELTRNDES